YHNSAKRASAITSQRLDRVLSNWRARIATQNREAAKVPDVVPFELVRSDIADERMKQAALWSMVFPFLMLIWSLTGAFYPAVDLCAGEKERGTLETLLVSPAERGEIVCGKLLTIMLFSCVTVVFNLLAVGATGWFLISKFEKLLVGMGPPPLLAFVWLFIAVIPVSALFSALCLALAAFARSTREGQYYLMPLFLITLPLVILPMQPSFDLNFGNSLIPVTGIVLLLRAAIQGDYGDALRYFLPVTAVTAVCCLLAIRWAIDQFNKESVLFREGERLDLGLWLKHIVRDRQQTPSPAAAFACVATILTITFFMRLAVAGKPGEIDSGSILRDTAILLLVGVFTPAALMTIFLARDFRQTLSLRRPKWLDIGAALLLAVAWHPLAMTLAEWVNRLYPVSEQNLAMLDELFKADKGPSIWVKLLVMALLPAVCEEIAFRGFILAGFRHLGRKRLAIFLSAFVFGVVHGWLQQSIVATVTGCVLGYVVVQTGSILPAMLIHFVNNALVVGLAEFDFKQIASHPVGGWFVGDAQPGSFLYQWPVVAAAALAVVLLWRYFHNLQYERSGEEALEEAIQRGTSGAPA
ncbi:MAG: CPBP family intramembrane metalloprotease, partial [Planctomycetes bacterium]|nr:CPBP family intramembrane metalloprotease [Planctomycetota bacterium]